MGTTKKKSPRKPRRRRAGTLPITEARRKFCLEQAVSAHSTYGVKFTVDAAAAYEKYLKSGKVS